MKKAKGRKGRRERKKESKTGDGKKLKREEDRKE